MAAIPATSPQTRAAIHVPETLTAPPPADEMPVDVVEVSGDATVILAPRDDIVPTPVASKVVLAAVAVTGTVTMENPVPMGADEAGATDTEMGEGEAETAACSTTTPVSIVASMMAFDELVELFM